MRKLSYKNTKKYARITFQRIDFLVVYSLKCLLIFPVYLTFFVELNTAQPWKPCPK